MRLILAEPRHAATVHRLMLDAFREYEGVLDPPTSALDESVDDVLAHMALGGAVLALSGDEAVGSGRFELRQGGVVYIGRLAVPKAWRGRGIATAMVAFIEDAARSAGCVTATLDCRLALDGNISLYERLGYAVVSSYVHPRGDARVVTMTRPLV